MNPIRKILFPTNFRGHSLSALRRLAGLKAAGLEEILLLNVLDRDEVGFVPFGGFDLELASELKEKAAIAFTEWESLLAGAGLRARRIIEVGDPEPKILEVAERENVAMIVVGRHVKLTDAVYPTGVEMGVLRDAKVPVLILPTEEEPATVPDKPLLERVALAAELAGEDDFTLELVAALKTGVQSLSLVNVVKPVEVDSLSDGETEELNAERRDKLAKLKAEVGALGLTAVAHLRSGLVAPELLEFCSEEKATALVMLTHGKRGVAELISGSVSHEVALHSKIPVFFVPRKK